MFAQGELLDYEMCMCIALSVIVCKARDISEDCGYTCFSPLFVLQCHVYIFTSQQYLLCMHDLSCQYGLSVYSLAHANNYNFELCDLDSTVLQLG